MYMTVERSHNDPNMLQTDIYSTGPAGPVQAQAWGGKLSSPQIVLPVRWILKLGRPAYIINKL